jgi:fibronectin-binding autotransporter adhesin
MRRRIHARPSVATAGSMNSLAAIERPGSQTVRLHSVCWVAALVASMAVGSGGVTRAANVAFDGFGGGDWGAATNWSTDTLPTADDIAVFGSDIGSATIYLEADRAVSGLQFTNTGATNLLGSIGTTGTGFILSLGSGGIVIDSGAGVVSIGGTSGSPANPQRIGLTLTASQSWTNNSSPSLAAPITFFRGQGNPTPGSNLDLGTHTLTFTGPGVTELRGGAIGGGSIVKQGTGTLLLGNDKTFTGGVQLDAGALGLINGTVLGTGTLTLNGGTIFSSAASRTLANASVWAGNFTVADPSGASVLNLTLSGPATLTGDRTVTVSDAPRVFAVGAMGESGGSFGLVKEGAGTLSLPEVSTYSGNTTVNAGGLVIGSVGSLPGWETAGRYSVASGGFLAFGNAVTDSEVATILGTGNLAAGSSIGFNTTADRAYASALSGSGGLVKLGPAMLTLSGINTYAGLTDVRQGILSIASTASLPGWDQPGRYTVAAGAALTVGNAVSDTDAATLLGAGNLNTAAAFGFDTAAGNRVYDGQLETLLGSQPFIKAGPNTLTLTGASSLSATSIVSAGTLEIGNGTSGSFSGPITNLSTVRFNQPDGSIFSGTISGAGSIEKVAPGSFTISTAISPGGIAVAEGRLTISSTLALPNAANVLSAAAGASLVVTGQVAGNTSSGQSLTLTGPGDFYLGQIQRTSFPNGSVTVTGGATLYAISASSPTSSQGHQFDGPLTIADGTVIAGNLNNADSNSSVGRNALIKMGSGDTSGTLSYQNPTVRSSIARQVQIGSADLPTGVGGAVIENVQAPASLGSGRMAFTLPAGATSFNLPVVASANRSLTLGGNSTAGNSVNPPIVDNLGEGGTISVVKRGTGLWQLGGENTYNGGTTIEAGTLSINGSVVGDISNDGTLRFNSNTNRTFAGLISGTGSLEKQGLNTLTLTAQNTYAGKTTFSSGLVELGAAQTGTTSGPLGTDGPLEFFGGGIRYGALNTHDYSPRFTNTVGQAIRVDTNDQNITWSAPIAIGTGSLRKDGVGKLTLTSASTIGGSVTVNAGTLEAAAPIGDGTATLFLSENNDSGTFRYVGSEDVVFASRQVQVGNVAAGTGSGVILSDGAGTLSFTRAAFSNSFGGATAARSLVLGGTNAGENRITGVISNNSATGLISLVKQGPGKWILGGANTFTGSTTVQGGVLQMANASALSTSQLVVVAGGTGQVAPFTSTSVAGLDLSGNGLVDVTTGALTVSSGLSAAQLVTVLLEGRGDGSWTGTSGITSSAAAADVASSIPRSVGWLDNGDGSLTVAYAAPGDTNLDWSIDILDAANFLALGKFDTGAPATWLEGDFSYDGIVDILDAADFFSTGLFDAGNYNTAPGSAGAVAAVPEPSAAALLATVAVAAAAWAARRNRGVSPF